MPVVHAEIDYLLPLRLSEEFTVEIRLVDIGARSIHFQARFLRGEEELAIARTVHVVASKGDLKAAGLPDWLEAALEDVRDDQHSAAIETT
jgi:acyl-CoA thioesterase FadM